MESSQLNFQQYLSRIGHGCEQLGGTDWGQVDPSEAKAAVKQSLDCGITVFDTADVYGLGRSEERLAEALGSDRHSVVIISKFGVRWETSGLGRAKTWRDASPSYARQALEASLRRLKLHRIPIYLLHWRDEYTPLEATLAELERCVEAGLIGCFGISNPSSHDLKVCAQFPHFQCIEVSFNALMPRTALDEVIVPDKLVITYGALGQGALTGKYKPGSAFPETDRRHRLPHFTGPEAETAHRVARAMSLVADELGVTTAQVAIAWCLQAERVTTVVVGAKNSRQALDNARAEFVRLRADHLRAIERARQGSPDYILEESK